VTYAGVPVSRPEHRRDAEPMPADRYLRQRATPRHPQHRSWTQREHHLQIRIFLASSVRTESRRRRNGRASRARATDQRTALPRTDCAPCSGGPDSLRSSRRPRRTELSGGIPGARVPCSGLGCRRRCTVHHRVPRHDASPPRECTCCWIQPTSPAGDGSRRRAFAARAPRRAALARDRRRLRRRRQERCAAADPGHDAVCRAAPARP
jgi:hypothetical protein